MFATLAGSYPWPDEPAAAEALAAVLEAQVEPGLGLLSDGRVHPATSSPGGLVAAWRRGRDAAGRLASELPVKLAVEGPWATGGPSGALDAARALNVGLAALADAGCRVVEIHEGASSLPSDEVGRALFAAAHEALLEGVADRLHACLAVTGGDAVAAGADAIFAAPYASHLFDLVDGPESWRLVAVAPGERGVILGVGDASGRGRTRLEDVVWAVGYAASTGGRGMERVGIAPSGSLAALDPSRAQAVLELLGDAVRTFAEGRDAALERLDPRAIDARTAALGHYQRERRRPGG